MIRWMPWMVLVAACDLVDPVECSLLYAPDQVSVTIVSASWGSGTYRVEADGSSCDVVLPGEGGPVADCDLDLYVNRSADGLAIASLNVWRAPEALEVALFLDDVEVDRQTLAPTYTESEPNGEGCGFVSFGEATWTIP